MDKDSRKDEVRKLLEKYQSKYWMDTYKSISDELNGYEAPIPSDVDVIESEICAKKTEKESINTYFGGKYGR